LRWSAALTLGLATVFLASCSLRPVPEGPKPQPPLVSAPPAPSPPAPAPPPPTPQLSVDRDRITQGDLAVLRLAGVPDLEQPPRLPLWDPAPAFVRVDRDWVALLPVSYAAKPGPRDVVVEVAGKSLPLHLTVTAKHFPESRVYVSQEKQDLLTNPQAEKEAQRIADLKGRPPGPPLWKGPLLMPVKGTVTTEFGMIRYVNDQVEGRHSGLDLAAPEGTPVKAAAAGRVVLAENLVVTGYTVILDHGLGLFTSYSHLSSLSVKAGDSVAAGQVVGKVGETGLATGPHLHWTVSIGPEPTDPWPLLKTDPLQPATPPTTQTTTQ